MSRHSLMVKRVHKIKKIELIVLSNEIYTLKPLILVQLSLLEVTK